jgi:hypothetical protein
MQTLGISIIISEDITSVDDRDPYVFGPPGSASGSVSYKYGSGSGSTSRSFRHQAKIVRKTLISSFFDFFLFRKKERKKEKRKKERKKVRKKERKKERKK